MKNFTLFLALTLCSTASFALECAYTPDQEIVRSAENMQEIRKLPASADVNQEQACGGNLLQLSILRGNPSNFIYLVEQGGDLNQEVSLKGYEIKGAPETVPFVMFVARYCPDSSIVDYMLENGADFKVKDSLGHDVFWYFEQNPVLRQSYLTKKGLEGLRPLSDIIMEEKQAAQQ